MKSFRLAIALALSVLSTSCTNLKPGQSLPIANPYLGQPPPGPEPEAFAPGLVTSEHYEYGGVFTPDLREFYFIRGSEDGERQDFVVFRNIDGRWIESVLSPRVGQPLIAPDGETMHLGGRYMTRNESGWSEPASLGVPFDDIPIMRLSVSSSGTYFFDEFNADLTGAIRFSRRLNGHHEEPRLLGETINTGRSFHPFIAPDESYLIFDSTRPGGYGDSDLYISYRQDDGSWGEAINLGERINTDAWEAAASVTPDGKYLFFNRNIGSDNYENVDILWVDAKFIETLRTE